MQDEPGASAAQRELADRQVAELKGHFNSQTLKNLLALLLTFFGPMLIDYVPGLQDKLISISPDWLDPGIPNFMQGIQAVLIAYFGARAYQGRLNVGDIKGLYKK